MGPACKAGMRGSPTALSIAKRKEKKKQTIKSKNNNKKIKQKTIQQDNKQRT